MTTNIQMVRPRADTAVPAAPIPTTVLPMLTAIAKSTRALIGIKLGDIGFHNGQDEFLLALEEDSMICVSALSERLAVRPSTVSKMMDRLAEKHLVERVADKDDSRRTMVRITPAGLAAKAVILRVHARIERDIASDMSRTELASMQDGLRTAQDRLASRLIRLR